MATIANLNIAIKGNTAQLNDTLTKAQTRIGKFRDGANRALKAVQTAAKGLAIGGGVALAGFGINAVKDFVQTGDELDKMSKRTGISVEALSELKFAAEQSGTSLESIETSSKRLSSTILDASNGMSGATMALDQLGLSAQKVQGLLPEEQFNTFAAALADIEDASTRAALAQDVFGRAGTDLLPLLSEGAEGMAALRQQAVDLGNTFTTEGAASAAEFQDSLNELKQGFGALGQTLGEKLVPVLTQGLDLFKENKGVQIALGTPWWAHWRRPWWS